MKRACLHSKQSLAVPLDTIQLRNRLHSQLLDLSYHAFEHCVRHLLREMGYTGVRVLDRVHWKGRNRAGGLDVEAYSDTGMTRVRMAVTVKHYTRPVQKRYVDELRGTMVRVGARQGLIITTSSFSPVAREAARQGATVPVRLVDGEELLDLLIAHRVGIMQGRSEKVQIDRAYFKGLRALYPGQDRRQSGGSADAREGRPEGSCGVKVGGEIAEQNISRRSQASPYERRDNDVADPCANGDQFPLATGDYPSWDL